MEEEKVIANTDTGNEISDSEKKDEPQLTVAQQEKHDDIVGRIEHTIAKIRPYIQADGGDVQLISYDDESGVVTVSMMGACAGCMAIDTTLTDGIEALLVDEVPEVSQVRLYPTGFSSPFGY